MNNAQESRVPHLVLSNLPVFLDEDEGYALDQRTIPEGDVVFADPDFWNDRMWNGFEIVRLMHNLTSYYAEKSIFMQSTKRKATVATDKGHRPLGIRK